ncbi:hypothetical protein LEP1GSC130_3501 [Leptospira santarosai str. 200403458]|nr:hypothetical protein LEP1GSC040_0395 [Leptospira santarosai str. 2000030832]EMO70690.1 hypothetical protein LEP1GSC130_3501 [Leptospira santarosai str. 200403458]EMO83899.1 hypothetical protein LEP1GSC070_0659 [Leptospira santarosai str. AIM]
MNFETGTFRPAIFTVSITQSFSLRILWQPQFPILEEHRSKGYGPFLFLSFSKRKSSFVANCNLNGLTNQPSSGKILF